MLMLSARWEMVILLNQCTTHPGLQSLNLLTLEQRQKAISGSDHGFQMKVTFGQMVPIILTKIGRKKGDQFQVIFRYLNIFIL